MTRRGIESWSLRLRIFLFFALIVAGSAAVVVAALVFVFLSADGAAPAVSRLVLAGLMSVFAISGLAFWVWMKFDDHVARPLMSLGAELRASVHAGAVPKSGSGTGRYLGLLAPAMQEAAQALAEARRDTDASVARAVTDAELEKSRLEAVLRDLRQAVVICTTDHNVLLYNRHAQALLDRDTPGESLGLERRLTALVLAQPLHHTLERLCRRLASGRHRTHPDGLSTPFLTATVGRRDSLRGRMTLTLSADEEAPIGYVAVFDEVTDELGAGIWRDRLLHDVTQDMRQRIASLSAAGEVLLRRADLTRDERREFDGLICGETRELAGRLERLDQVAGDLLAGAWPMAEVYSPTLTGCIVARRSEDRDLEVTTAGTPIWLMCDSASIVELVDRMLNRVAIHARIRRLEVSLSDAGENACLDIAYEGDPVPVARLDDWLEEPLEEGGGAMSGRDVLSRHKTEMWSDANPAGGARVRLPLARPPQAYRRAKKALAPVPERPEFYDFDLFARQTPAAIGDAPLASLSYVVFDTETTGLEPSRGDEMLSVAGVRIVNGRVLRGETFSAFVNPGRSIPAASTRVHGITDEMVANAPGVETVLPSFHGFTRDSVLVAHNAAFDMTFLAKYRGRSGVVFDQPVLDTVLLAAHVFGTQESLTLDALAERFEVSLPPETRHTALGDALATAEVFSRLVKMLAPLGVRTLDDAVSASNRQVALRRRQTGY
ncbi:3'-5' exonuclease [Stappia stellulata]|uniref:3'-5' exonuclease n=1 Tax=Stappia stellulata TaxID=71235 RepID=UPI0003FD37B7|nr:exonuclease domain-containing protein [Stappia stellulata]